MNDLETTERPAPETAPETPDETSESPTYLHNAWFALDHYVCLRCGHEDWSLPTLAQHMAVYHQGVMIEAPPGYEPPSAEEETPRAEDTMPAEQAFVDEAALSPETTE